MTERIVWVIVGLAVTGVVAYLAWTWWAARQTPVVDANGDPVPPGPPVFTSVSQPQQVANRIINGTYQPLTASGADSGVVVGSAGARIADATSEIALLP